MYDIFFPKSRVSKLREAEVAWDEFVKRIRAALASDPDNQDLKNALAHLHHHRDDLIEKVYLDEAKRDSLELQLWLGERTGNIKSILQANAEPDSGTDFISNETPPQKPVKPPESPKFNRLVDKYLFDLWRDCGSPEKPGKFKEGIKSRKDHKDGSAIGRCYGLGTKGKHQWTFEIVINGVAESIPYSTLGNKVRAFKKRVNPSK